MKLRVTFYIFGILWLNISNLSAVKAYPFPIEIQQPDGSMLTILLHGDESFNYRTTSDGFKIQKNKSGFFVYSEKDYHGKIVPGKIIARNASERSTSELRYLSELPEITTESMLLNTESRMKMPQADIPGTSTGSTGFPRTGSPRSLVILVNFSDTIFKIADPKTAYTKLLNEAGYAENGGTGSSKDYFMSASNGKFSPQFDVAGPFNLPKPMSYYGKNMVSNDNDTLAVQMVVDACTAANAGGVDFTPYDTDGDGFLDNVFIYYAGHNEAEGASDDAIWPHRWVVQRGFNYSGTVNTLRFDGKTLFDYACTSELRGKSGTTMCGIGTFTHEFGHVLGLVDLYHTSTTSKKTLDFWDIMDIGVYLNAGRTPPTYSAYERFYLGWLKPQEINTPSDLTLYPLSQSKTALTTTKGQAYLLSQTTHNLSASAPSPAEFFIAEYRKKTGWDTYLPAEGILFWHIDYLDTAWNDNTVNNYTGTTQTAASHMRVYLQPLTGQTSTPGSAFTSGSFTPFTWQGTDINRAITNISKTTDKIDFQLMGGTPTPLIRAGLILNSVQFPKVKPGLTDTKKLRFQTKEITGDLQLTITGEDNSLFSASSVTLLKDTLNSVNGVEINITYSPLVNGVHKATMTLSGGGLSPDKVIELKGICN